MDEKSPYMAWYSHARKLEVQLAECQRQRDAAVEALKYLLEVFIDEYERNHPGWRCDGYEVVVVARKALALCEPNETDNMPKKASS